MVSVLVPHLCDNRRETYRLQGKKFDCVIAANAVTWLPRGNYCSKDGEYKSALSHEVAEMMFCYNELEEVESIGLERRCETSCERAKLEASCQR